MIQPVAAPNTTSESSSAHEVDNASFSPESRQLFSHVQHLNDHPVEKHFLQSPSFAASARLPEQLNGHFLDRVDAYYTGDRIIAVRGAGRENCSTLTVFCPPQNGFNVTDLHLFRRPFRDQINQALYLAVAGSGRLQIIKLPFRKSGESTIQTSDWVSELGSTRVSSITTSSVGEELIYSAPSDDSPRNGFTPMYRILQSDYKAYREGILPPEDALFTSQRPIEVVALNPKQKPKLLAIGYVGGLVEVRRVPRRGTLEMAKGTHKISSDRSASPTAIGFLSSKELLIGTSTGSLQLVAFKLSGQSIRGELVKEIQLRSPARHIAVEDQTRDGQKKIHVYL